MGAGNSTRGRVRSPHLFALRKDGIYSTALVFLFQENFREAETAAGRIAKLNAEARQHLKARPMSAQERVLSRRY